MKIRDVTRDLNEGPLDALKKAGAAIKGFATGGLSGARAGVAQQSGAQFTKAIADRVFNTWNQYLVNIPPNSDPNQALVNFLNTQFHEVKGSALPPPRLRNVKDTAQAKNYILQRTQEYVAKRMAPQQQVPQGQLHAGYPFPKAEADVEMPNGYTYGYDLYGPQGAGWYSDTSGDRITDPAAIQTLNKRYLDMKRAAAAGQGKDPDQIEQPGQEIAQQELDLGTPLQNLPPRMKRQGGLRAWKARQQQYANPAQATTVVANPPAATTTTSATVPSPTEPETPANVKPFPTKKPVKESKQLNEGGNEIPNAEPVPQEDVPQVVNLAKQALPKELLANLQTDIGSGGYKVQSGDIDLMVEAQDVVDFFGTANLPDPLKAAKIMLKKHFEAQGIYSSITGRNVHIGVEYTQQAAKKKSVGQVDVMVIHEAAVVAPWHQHGPRGMYKDAKFKANEIFILISSIAKHLGLKFDPFAAKLINRDTGEVVGRTRDEVAKILLNPKAKESDLDSVGSILKALEFDADREGKLAQAKADAAKGLIRLPESAPFNTAAYYRKISDVVA